MKGKGNAASVKQENSVSRMLEDNGNQLKSVHCSLLIVSVQLSTRN